VKTAIAKCQERHLDVDPCTTLLVRYPLFSIFRSEMTVLLGFVDEKDGAVLAADGEAADGAGRTVEDEWKIARLTTNSALGFSGMPYYGNQILANLMQVSHLADQGERIRIVRYLEENRRVANPTTSQILIDTLDHLLSHLTLQFVKELRKRDNVQPIETSFLGAVSDEIGSRLIVWAQRDIVAWV